MRLLTPLLLLSLASAARAGTLELTTPLSLSISDGAASATATGGASDLSIYDSLGDFTGNGWSASVTLALPGTYNAGVITEPSPLSFGFTNVYLSCTFVGGCPGTLDVAFSFALQLDSGFGELAGMPMTSTISLNPYSLSAHSGTFTTQGSFTNSLSVASTYLRSFAVTAFGFGNATVGNSFTNAGVGTFGPAGNLGALTVSGDLRLTGLSNSTWLQFSSIDYTFNPQPSSVPEPGTLALAFLGVALLLTAIRRSSLRRAAPVRPAAAPVLPETLAGNAAARELPRNWTRD